VSVAQWWASCNSLDVKLCRVANRAAHRRRLLGAMRLVSRLGDGVIWYALMLAMPILCGKQGWFAGLHLAAVAAVGFLLYRLLKNRLVRERPFVRLVGIECFMAPLDRYSFPSGHTLHAVSLTLTACAYVPMLAAILIPFTLAVAASRVILGLHYPSDVLAGAVLGVALAAAGNAAFG
jgi:undecaprenyl-diphosphatase